MNLIDKWVAMQAVQRIDSVATLRDGDPVIRMSAVEHVLENLPEAEAPDINVGNMDTTTHDSIPAETGKNDGVGTSGDCISRQAAIDALLGITAMRNTIPLDSAIFNIKKLPSVQPETNCSEIPNSWIPCSERLPEKEGWYITTVESEKTGKRRIENDLFAVDIALAHGHTPNKFCKDGYRQRTVAWIPFPEPYQAERREDG